jgi:hypothetical protein
MRRMIHRVRRAGSDQRRGIVSVPAGEAIFGAIAVSSIPASVRIFCKYSGKRLLSSSDNH